MASYAAKLIQDVDKGRCGDAEFEDTAEVITVQARQLAALIRASRHCILHTGAGISTAAGICDFRGPQGVWTREKLGLDPLPGTPFDQAQPTFTHRAIVRLVECGFVKHVVSQNVDGLHIRSGLPRESLSEVHGTAFAEWCDRCNRDFRTDTPVETIGLRRTGNECSVCGSELRDMLCDWDSELPDHELNMAIEQHRRADLCICVGSSMRIRPAGTWPDRTIRRNGKPDFGKVVVINLQKTHLDKKCHLRIFGKADDVFKVLASELQLQVDHDPSF